MKWARTPYAWKRRFALIPICISSGSKEQWVWLEWYWSRFAGDCYETVLQTPDRLPGDEFRGDDEKLCASIDALLALDKSGCLVPHGIGGHARALLKSAAVRLRGRANGAKP